MNESEVKPVSPATAVAHAVSPEAEQRIAQAVDSMKLDQIQVGATVEDFSNEDLAGQINVGIPIEEGSQPTSKSIEEQIRIMPDVPSVSTAPVETQVAQEITIKPLKREEHITEIDVTGIPGLDPNIK